MNHLFTQKRGITTLFKTIRGEKILKKTIKYQKKASISPVIARLDDTCYNILEKMNTNQLKYINILDKDGEKNMISYSDVYQACKFQDWCREEDEKILADINHEK